MGLIGLYWSARQESLDHCSDHCLASLSALQTHGYNSLFLKGRTRKAALKQPFEVSLAAVYRLLERGVNRRDSNHQRIPEFGFSFSLWSGGSGDEAYSVSATCGSYSQYVGNHFVLDLPSSGPRSLPSSLESALALFGALIEIWAPDKGIICDSPDTKVYLRYPNAV